VPCGSRIALICAGGRSDAHRENHRTGISRDRAFGGPPLVVLCGGTGDLATFINPSCTGDSRVAADAVTASGRACVDAGAAIRPSLADYRRVALFVPQCLQQLDPRGPTSG